MDLLNVLWVLLCGFMVLDMQAGFLCLETGLSRVKNASNIALKNVSDICVVTLAYWLVGFGLMFGQSHNGWWGLSLFASGWSTVDFDIAPFLFFQMAFATTAVTIVSGAVAERASFAGYLVVGAFIATLIYPVVGHAAWAGLWLENQSGWLEEMGFLDFAGATVVHSVGGWAALTYCIALGPRRGRFGRKFRKFQPSSFAMASLGVIFLWIGWAGFNAGSALAVDAAVGPIIVRTMLGAAAGGAMAIVLSLLVFGYASAHLTLNGVIAGLVAGTAGVNMFSSVDAIVVGAFGSMAMAVASFAIRAAKIDDVVDSVPVHLVPGILGTLAVPFLIDAADMPAGGFLAQLGVQAIAVFAVAVWTCASMFIVIACVKRVTPIRVRPRDEVLGLDASEHGIGNAFLDLLNEMKQHQRTGRFESRVAVERSTDVGLVAYRYNKVLDRVQQEIVTRIDAMQREQEMRVMAETAFAAMKEAQTESAHAARHDRLTGLGNRRLLDEIAAAEDMPAKSGLLALAIDLDRFKAINDRHGHDAGDAVLVATATRLKSVMKEDKDFGFRIGGDEFVVLLDWSSRDDPRRFCEQLCEKLSVPVDHNALSIEYGASIGFVFSKEDGKSLQTVLKQADMALYAAKKNGRGRVISYSEQIGVAYSSHVEELAFFRHALVNNEIEAFVQTQVNAVTREVVGCEFLARWQHPEKGLVGPDHFLPLAEEMNMASELDREILNQAIEFHHELASSGCVLDTLSVNVSARRLSDPNLIDELRARADLPKGLAFEILETAHLDVLGIDLSDTVSALKSLGVLIEIDDFGTGHASFASILSLKPDTLKIDRMFVAGITDDPVRAELMQSLIGIAARFGAATIVEGVETLSEADTLTRLGADRLQGYVFSKPMRKHEMLSLLLEETGHRRA